MIQNLVHTVGSFLAGDIAMTLYWCAAIGGTVFFLVALLFSSFEVGGVDSPDVAADGTFDVGGHVDTGFADFQFISMKSIFAYVTMFGWVGVVWGKSGWIGFIAAFLIGLLAMFLTALAVWMMPTNVMSWLAMASNLIFRFSSSPLVLCAVRMP